MSEDLEKKIGDIQIVSITEHEDGSASVLFEMDPELIKLFAEMGLRQALTDSIRKMRDDFKNEHS